MILSSSWMEPKLGGHITDSRGISDASSLVDRLVVQYGRKRDALLPILHAFQHEIGYIDDAAVPLIATALNISRADVHGVVTFYHDFRRTPAGRHVVKLCRAESCQARGGALIEAEAADRLGDALKKDMHDFVVGPAAPVVNRIRSLYLMDILIKLPKDSHMLQQYKRVISNHFNLLHAEKRFRSVTLIADVDPM